MVYYIRVKIQKHNIKKWFKIGFIIQYKQDIEHMDVKMTLRYKLLQN